MVKLKWIPLLLLLVAGASLAQGPAAARKQIEHSMLVTGHVLIEADGSVSGWEIDQRETLPPVVSGLIEDAAPMWRFEPVLVDGRPGRVKAPMSLRFTANRLDDDNYRIAIQSGYFGREAMKVEERMAMEGTDVVQVLKRRPPTYPMQAAASGTRGTVYVLLRIGRDGRVQEAIAEQVNLRTVGTPRQMTSMREMLGRSAVRAVREWTFQPPTTGELAQEAEWSGRVTVDYLLDGEKGAVNGEWHAYIPGPRQRAPWLQEDDLADGESPDTMLAGGFQGIGQGLKLLTPLQGG